MPELTIPLPDWDRGTETEVIVDHDLATEALRYFLCSKSWDGGDVEAIYDKRVRIRAKIIERWRQRQRGEAVEVDAPPETWQQIAVRMRSEGAPWQTIAAKTGQTVGRLRLAVKRATPGVEMVA